jgi:signal transduction histidine kinase
VSYRSPGAPAGVPPPDPAIRGNQVRWRGPNREVTHSVPGGMRLVVGKPGGLMQARLHAFAWKLAALGAGILALGMAVGSWLVGVALRPIGDIARTARQIAGGDWQQRIPATGDASELGALATVLNESFERIENNYAQQKRFSADAAHELGNPVAIILSQTQHALGRPREPREYVSALEACRRAGERMKAMTRDLLDLEGYESGRRLSQRIDCDLAEIVREACEAVGGLAEERRAEIVEDLQPVRARVHAASLGRAVINLIGNAIQHNADGVRVEVRLRATGGEACLQLADDGRGIPPAARPYLFDRFYRIDPNSGRSEGRGLGLAIVKAIVAAHGGSVAVEGAPGEGACFVVRLPLA